MDRAYIHLEQRRYDRAIPEIKLHLSEEPEDVEALTLLALCHINLEEYSEGLKYSKEALGILPDNDFTFYTLARAQFGLSNNKAALQAINEAIELEPEDPDYFGLKALILSNKTEWQLALECCIAGLILNPEHIECNNIKALCLRKLNLTNEEAATLLESLRQNPEDAFTHANLGWSYLEKGERDKSLEHFHQALRIDPEFEWARDGVMKAMKSKNILYRTMLKYFFWIGKKKSSHQQTLLFGLFIGYIIILNLSYSYPALDYLVYAYMAFALSTWFNEPFFTSFMYMSKEGRIILRDREKRESLFFISLAVSTIVLLVIYIINSSMAVFYGMFLCLGLLMGLSTVTKFSTKEGIQQGLLFMLFFGIFMGTSLTMFIVGTVWASYFFHAGLYLLLGFEFFMQDES